MCLELRLCEVMIHGLMQVMRAALAAAEGGGCAPKEKLKIKGATIVVDTWRSRC